MLGFLALATAALAGFEIATWDHIAPGVVALGAPVGGVTRSQAAERVMGNVNSLLQQPIDIRYSERHWTITAQGLGLRLDPNDIAAAAYLVGREGNPAARLADQFGSLIVGRHVLSAAATDQAALDAWLLNLARDLDRAPRDARLVLAKDGTIDFTPAISGITIDVPGSRDRIIQALSTSGATVDLAVRETPPQIPDTLVQPALQQLERIVGGGEVSLTLKQGSREWPMQRANVVKLLAVEPPGKPNQPASIVVDNAALRAFAQDLAKDIDQGVQEARVLFNGGNLKALRESREGRTLDQAATVELIRGKLLAGDRVADLPVAIVKPRVSSDDLPSLGITALLERGSTSFAGGIPEKQSNIRLAAERLNGVVVPPGGVFSFNREVGATTIESGFKWGFGITSGTEGIKTIPSVAGGICQVATTLFQPVFWAGYPLEERYWHLYWIPAYTSRGVVGLDVTVDEESGLDFKWINPTDDYVLIQSASDEGNVYFALYGKKPSWTVQVDDPQISNRTPPDPKPAAEEAPTLPWGRTLQVESAREGFDVLVTRRVIPNAGGDPRVLSLKSTYQPSRNVTLVGTQGKPADARVEDVINRIVKPEETKPALSGTPAAGATPPAGQATQPAAGTPVQPTATPTPATTPRAAATPTPGSTPRAAATVGTSGSSGAAKPQPT